MIFVQYILYNWFTRLWIFDTVDYLFFYPFLLLREHKHRIPNESQIRIIIRRIPLILKEYKPNQNPNIISTIAIIKIIKPPAKYFTAECSAIKMQSNTYFYFYPKIFF